MYASVGNSPEAADRPDLRLHSSISAESEGSNVHRIWHFNIAFLGTCRAGKTKLLQRFVDSEFSDIYSATQETTFVSKSLSIGRHHVVFQCWDTPGSVRHAGCLDNRLTQLHAVFIVFDASRDTLADLEHWHHLAMHDPGRSEGERAPLLVMVANKTDLGCHQASMARARDLCRAAGGLNFSLSVLADEENLEVDAMMLEVDKALTERQNDRVVDDVPIVTSQPRGSTTSAPTVEGDKGGGLLLRKTSPAAAAATATALLSPVSVDIGNGEKAKGDVKEEETTKKKAKETGGGTANGDRKDADKKGLIWQLWWATCCCNCCG